jgi:hypothetical protein
MLWGRPGEGVIFYTGGREPQRSSLQTMMGETLLNGVN